MSTEDKILHYQYIILWLDPRSGKVYYNGIESTLADVGRDGWEIISCGFATTTVSQMSGDISKMNYWLAKRVVNETMAKSVVPNRPTKTICINGKGRSNYPSLH